MWNKIGRIAMAVMAIGISAYPITYLASGERVNFLSLKPDELYFSAYWQTGFHMHIIFGGIALLIGWIQFFPRVRNRYLNFHRWTGRIYTMAVILGGAAGIYLAVNANGGIYAKTGFFLLGVGWTSTAVAGYFAARKRHIDRHEVLMIFSYAFCYAAVTLRIWLPLLTGFFGAFEPAYRIVSWLCWVPNIMVAYWIVLRMKRRVVAYQD